MPADEASTLAFRTCPLCEATCGLEIEVGASGRIGRIRGDRDDVFSHGFICPKGSTLKQLHEDPDRLRTPLVRDERGILQPATWDEAFQTVERRLGPIVEHHGRDALAIYLGNPNVHNLAGLLYGRSLVRALGTRNVFSASTVDQRPKELSTALMFGTPSGFGVPDLDRTDYLLILGANPWASNGSLATAPDWPGRLKGIRARSGRVVVVDPMRTRTAEEADEHLPIVPGADAWLLMGMVHALFDEDLVDVGQAAPYVTGLDEVASLAQSFTPERVGPPCGINAGTIRRLARELAAAPSAVVYGRVGTCTQEFGTLASWLIDVLNVLTGNLDRPGGLMFSTPAAGSPNTRGAPRQGRTLRLGRTRSRVRNLPETLGELPVVCMAEEIDTPGAGQIRALFCVAGNPVLSTPNGARLDAALGGLDLLVSVDLYVNETSRHAHVVFPSPSPLQRSHYDLAFWQFSVRNVANYSPPVLPLDDGALDEWKILAKLALIAQGAGAEADPAIVDELTVGTLVRSAIEDRYSPVFGQDEAGVLASLAPRTGPERILDFMLRTGPFGISLDDLLARPHGMDFGPLEPRMPEMIRTASGMVELAPGVLVADVERLRTRLDSAPPHHRTPAAPPGAPPGADGGANGGANGSANGSGLVLIGRRHLRSNNSWMHNVEVLVKGAPRCTLQVNPVDAERLGLADGKLARVSSRAGALEVAVEVTAAMSSGVVSLPHGWGHGLSGAKMAVAAAHPGVNSNLLADERLFDVVSGNATLNGIPVEVAPA